MDKTKEVHEWFNFGQCDYDTAIYLQGMIPPPLEIICCHFQQAAEKYLKGYLIANEKPVIKTHDLSFLVEICIEIDFTFENIHSACENLTDYSISTRYPGNIELSRADMEKAMTDCIEIIQFIDKLSESFLK